MQTFNPSQLYGTGSIITIEMDSTTTFRFRSNGASAPNHVYITFDVIGGGSTTVPGLANSNFTSIDVLGNKLHTAYSTTNWAYSFPKGVNDTGAANTLIGSNLPEIPVNTIRVRGLGMDPSNTVSVLTIQDEVPAIDPDAQLFFDAIVNDGGSLTSTEEDAINTLVIDLKAASLWTPCQAIYPIVGGTAITHKFNLKDPIDDDAAFRLTFTLGWTHAATGMTPNGTTAFADTHFIPETTPIGNLVSRDDAHFSIYSRTNAFGGGANANKIDLGCTQVVAILCIRPANPITVTFAFDRTPAAIDAIPPIVNTLGLFTLTREAVDELYAYQDNTSVGSNLNPHSAVSMTHEIYLGASNTTGVASNFSNRQLAFASIGTSLTSVQLSSFYTIVQDYQSTLGRSV